MTNPAHRIIEGLGGKTYGGGQAGTCFCPAHDDRHRPSLSVSVRNGKLLVKCHAGCDQQTVIAALKQRGLWPNAERTTGQTQTQQHNDEAKHPYYRQRRGFDILHAAAKYDAEPRKYLKNRCIDIVPRCAMLLPASETSRLLNKRFPAVVLPVITSESKLTGAHVIFLDRDASCKLARTTAKKSYGPIGGGYVPLSPIDPERPLIVGEGVETTLSAMQIADLPGIATLGTPGMKAVDVPKCSEVIIAADRDKEGQGVKAAKSLAQRLVQSGRVVRIAKPEFAGEDWNDVLREDGGDPDKLKELKRRILKAPKFDAADVPDGDDALTMSEFLALDIPPMSRLVDPILVMPGTTMLTAQPGGGKTRLSMSLAYAVATGEPLMDWRVPKVCKVMYIDAELQPETIRDWLRRLGPHADNLKILSDKWNYRNKRPPVTLATEEGRDYLEQQIDRHDPKLIVLDALMTLDPPEMVQGQAKEDHWPPIIRWITNQKNKGRHVLLLHHDNKSGSQYGSMVKEIQFDLMMQMKPKKEWSKHGRWAFELTCKKPRHMSVEQATPRIISANDAGPIEWRREGATSFAEAEVFEMLDEGVKQSQIAKQLKLTPARISQIAAGRKSREEKVKSLNP